uniref:AraC family transcriptional regulator ligand-binding domain-containing protein n=1 Tax=Pandoraea sputorum TaxID=93222 RepID=UPI003555D0D4
RLLEDSEGAWLRFYSISPYNAYNRFVVDSLLSGWLSQLSGVADRSLQAQRIEIEFNAPDYAAAYAALSEQPVVFAAATNQLRLGNASLEIRNPAHCPSTWQQLVQLCELELERLTRTRSLRERIISLLGPLLNGGREPDL